MSIKKCLSLAAVVVLCLALVAGVACGGGEEGEDKEEYMPLVTTLLAHDPDLFVSTMPILRTVWDMGYEGQVACYSWYEAYAEETLGWDTVQGTYIFMPHALINVVDNPWPEATALAQEFKDRYNVAC